MRRHRDQDPDECPESMDALHRSLEVLDLRNQRAAILAVMLPSTPWPKDLELRVRSRYAVLSAFSSKSLEPWDTSRIGYTVWLAEEYSTLAPYTCWRAWRRGCGSPTRQDRSEWVPFYLTGPTSSDTWRNIIHTQSGETPLSDRQAPVENFRIYSPSATWTGPVDNTL